MKYIDAGTSFSKIMCTNGETLDNLIPVETIGHKSFYIVLSQQLSDLGIKFDGGTGHMTKDYLKDGAKLENEILLCISTSKAVISLSSSAIEDLIVLISSFTSLILSLIDIFPQKPPKTTRAQSKNIAGDERLFTAAFFRLLAFLAAFGITTILSFG